MNYLAFLKVICYKIPVFLNQFFRIIVMLLALVLGTRREGDREMNCGRLDDIDGDSFDFSFDLMF